MDRKVSKKQTELKYTRSDRKHCTVKSMKYLQRQYNKSLRQYNRQICEALTCTNESQLY
jgi:hypothetical protein